VKYWRTSSDAQLLTSEKVKMKSYVLSLISMVGMLSLLLAACGTQTATPVAETLSAPAAGVIAEGNIRPFRASNLSFQVAGVVEEVNVKIGDPVREGDVLVRLANAGAAEAQALAAQQALDLLIRDQGGDRAELWQAHMDAQDARGRAEKKWDDLNIDNIEDRIEDAEDEVEDRTVDLEREQEEFDKFKDLGAEDEKRKDAEDDLETAQENLNDSIRDLESIMRERDEVRAAYEAALALEAEAKYQYNLALNGPNADQLALAEAQLDAALDALDGYVLRAPFDGVVADVSVKAGEQMSPGTRAVSVADFDSWIVETSDITELEVVKISEGQSVSIEVDALPDVMLDGEVIEISQSSILQGGDVLYTVRIRVDEVDPRVRWGMTAETTFLETSE
jgi:multidrug resistance efflux pump